MIDTGPESSERSLHTQKMDTLIHTGGVASHELIDTTGDGVKDAVAADTTGDGVMDTVIMDTTGAPRRFISMFDEKGLHLAAVIKSALV